MYEIRGVSHFDAGQVSRRDLVFQTLDLTGIFDALIDRMDAVGKKMLPPPASKSGRCREPGAANKNGDEKTRCRRSCLKSPVPLSVYYRFPAGIRSG